MSPTDFWVRFVDAVVKEIHNEWGGRSPSAQWRKSDGSRVTDLDLRLDTAIRVILARHYSTASVVSEEIGVLNPATDSSSRQITAIVDPVDGTESLVNGRHSWWTSIGLLVDERPAGGLIYQPSTQVLHDSMRPAKKQSHHFTIGMSPDQLEADEAAGVRRRFLDHGAELRSIPHASEKVAAVLEGRCTASVYLPSSKSPGWHSWDLAACIAIASANNIVLRSLSGSTLQVALDSDLHNDAWICAYDEKSWAAAQEAILQ